MTEITDCTDKCKPVAIDVASLAHAMRSSPTSFRAMVRAYERQGVTSREIVAAMAASPHLIDAVGRRR
jgi:hypothetical protein